MSTLLHHSRTEVNAAPLVAASLEERSLARAFASFSAAASSLERSYLQLQAEAARLREELEVKNRDLANSLAENRHMGQHLDRILEGLPCGVLVLEPEGRISRANPETRRLLGAIGGRALESLDPAPVWVQEFLADAPPGPEEREYACQNGDAEWIAVRRAQLAEDEGGSSIFILQDRTANKRLEQERESHRRRQALAEMSTLLAHEIRNPLGSLELFAGLLAASDLADEPRCWVSHLQAGLRLLSATVNNVFHFHGHPELQQAPVDLGVFLRSLVQFLEPVAEQAGVRLELAAPFEGVEVAADRHRLEQVVLNLALNAFRAMPGGGVLRILGQLDLEASGLWASVSLSDSGTGIPSEDLARIFDPGFTTQPGSPGLGLSVARTIMEQHGGKLRVASGCGRGTTFTLMLPGLGESR